MCGIVGFINKNSSLLEANQFIKHRGPDSQGTFYYNNLSLGHTRLSILDLTENGNQPMLSECGNFVIVFNGEIYNHLEIRERYIEGRTFKSNSDTETLLYGFIENGEEILDYINGIFAFAIFDKKRNKIFIARDQFGVKPLYFYMDEDYLWFSSEIKTILNTNFDREICNDALANYLTFLYSPGDKTPFLNVKKLLPGHFLEFNLNDFKDSIPIRYYDIPINPLKSTKSEFELIEELDTVLTKAVKRQMLSDVPVGFFLSGGLDSSALVAIARKLFPERKFNCYTIKTNDGEDMEDGFVNDLQYARQVAKHLNVNLIEVDANIDIVQEFDHMIYHLDEPQADPAPLSVFNICQQARKDGNIVLIGGTAGDDIFSGYRRHQALNIEKYLKITPLFIRKLIRKMIFLLPVNKSFARRLRKLTNNIHLTEDERLAGYFSWLDKLNVDDLFVDEIKESLNKYDVMNYHKKMLEVVKNEKELLNKILYLEMKTFLVDHNLNYTDKMSMSTGVEVRVPFLDKELVEFSTKIPVDLKMKGMTTKYILKKVMEKYLPHDVIYRPKSGFGAPVRKWITELLDEKINTVLSKNNINRRGIFKAEKVHKLIAENKAGKVDASYTIWCLLAIESWMQQFLDKENID